MERLFFKKTKIKLFPSVKRLNEDFNERGTHPPSPSLGKRRGDDEFPLLLRPARRTKFFGRRGGIKGEFTYSKI
jgi:hypothetical protein